MKISISPQAVLVCVAILSCFLCSSCDFIGVIASPTRHEQKVPAQFDLNSRLDDKILILIDKSPGTNCDVELQAGLSKAVEIFITEKTRLEGEDIASADSLSLLNTLGQDSFVLDPLKIGTELSVDIVLYILIEKYSLYEMAGQGYYEGSLTTRSMLFDINSSKVLWPLNGESRKVIVDVELGGSGRKAAVVRMARTTGHCIIRNFYNCRKDQFKIAEERKY